MSEATSGIFAFTMAPHIACAHAGYLLDPAQAGFVIAGFEREFSERLNRSEPLVAPRAMVSGRWALYLYQPIHSQKMIKSFKEATTEPLFEGQVGKASPPIS